jgi:hypothetical protein
MRHLVVQRMIGTTMGAIFGRMETLETLSGFQWTTTWMRETLKVESNRLTENGFKTETEPTVRFLCFGFRIVFK